MVIEKAVDRALVWINKVLAIAHDIAIKRDRTVFIQVSVSRTHNLFVMHVLYTHTHTLFFILYLMHDLLLSHCPLGAKGYNGSMGGFIYWDALQLLYAHLHW